MTPSGPVQNERKRMQTPLSTRVPPAQPRSARRPGGGRLLEPEQIRTIRRLFHTSGFSANQLAVQFGVSRQLVSAITRGEIYRDVSDEPDESEQEEPEDEPEPEPEPIEEEEIVMSDVIALATHPAAPRLTAEELAQVVVDSVPCTLCGVKPGKSCVVYQDVDRPKYNGHRPEIGKPRPPHRRRITLARRRGVI